MLLSAVLVSSVGLLSSSLSASFDAVGHNDDNSAEETEIDYEGLLEDHDNDSGKFQINTIGSVHAAGFETIFTVEFDPLEEDESLEFHWIMGDGSVLVDEDPGVVGSIRHIYQESGSFDVELYVIDPDDGTLLAYDDSVIEILPEEAWDNDSLDISYPLIHQTVSSLSIFSSSEIGNVKTQSLKGIEISIESVVSEQQEVSVLSHDMAGVEDHSSDTLIVSNWMLLEMPEEVEFNEEGYSWILSLDPIDYGYITEDMVREDSFITIDFEDNLRNNAEYSLVIFGTMPVLNTIFGITHFDMESDEVTGDIEISSDQISDTTSILYEEEDSGEEDEYWTEERRENAEPMPMPKEDTNRNDVALWIGSVTIIAFLLLSGVNFSRLAKKNRDKKGSVSSR